MGDDIIVISCKRLLEEITSPVDRKEFFDICVWERMANLYERENEEYDELLGKLEMNIDYCQYNQVKVCVRKLLRLLSKNRRSLIQNIERLGA